MIRHQTIEKGELVPTKNPSNRMILFILFTGVLMGALDIAIVGPALRPIKDSFGVSTRDMTAIFTFYVLMNLVGTPILAKLADIFGRRRVYLAAVALFACGSLMVAFAPYFTFVLGGRAIQGFGAGGIFPIASATIGDIFPPDKRGRYLGLIGAVFGLAFLIGPLIGGVLLLAGWHWIFLINVPIALVILVLTAKHLPRESSLGKVGHRSFDWLGTLALSLMLGCFVFGLSRLDTNNLLASFSDSQVWPYLLGAALLVVIIIAVEKRAESPVISPRLFATRQLNITHALAFGAGCLESGMVFIPALTITAFNVSSSNSSFLLLPAVGAVALGSPVFGRSLDAKGARPTLMIATSLLIAGLAGLVFFIQNFGMFFFATFLIGFGMSGLLGAPLRYILLNEVEQSHRSSAQGIMTLFMSAGQLICAASLGAIIASSHGTLQGYSTAYTILGVMCLILLVLSTKLKGRNAPISASTETV